MNSGLRPQLQTLRKAESSTVLHAGRAQSGETLGSTRTGHEPPNLNKTRMGVTGKTHRNLRIVRAFRMGVAGKTLRNPWILIIGIAIIAIATKVDAKSVSVEAPGHPKSTQNRSRDPFGTP